MVRQLTCCLNAKLSSDIASLEQLFPAKSYHVIIKIQHYPLARYPNNPFLKDVFGIFFPSLFSVSYGFREAFESTPVFHTAVCLNKLTNSNFGLSNNRFWRRWIEASSKQYVVKHYYWSNVLSLFKCGGMKETRCPYTKEKEASAVFLTSFIPPSPFTSVSCLRVCSFLKPSFWMKCFKLLAA